MSTDHGSASSPASNRLPSAVESTPASGASRGRPVGPAANRDERAQGGQHLVLTALHALRLQWPWLLLLGVPLGAALGYVAWTTTPTPYTAYAELFCQPRRFFWDTKEEGPRFDVYKQTTMRLIKDPLVLTAALRDPKMAKAELLSGSVDALETLNKELQVSSPATEFIRLQLSGRNPQELANVVNAVVDAFVTEVVVKEQDTRKARLADLQRLLSQEEEQLKLKQNELRAIDKRMEAPTQTQMDVKRQSQIDLQLQLRREMSQLHPQIIELELLLASDETASADEPQESPAVEPTDEEIEGLYLQDGKVLQLTRQRARLQTLLDEWLRRVRLPHPEVDQLTLDVKALEDDVAKRKEELEPLIQQQIQSQRMSASGQPQLGGSRAQLEGRHAMLKGLLERYQTELEGIQLAERKQAVEWVDRESLSEEIASLKAMSDIYSQETQKLRVELENAPPAIRVHQRARPPTTPDEKKRYMYTFAGLVAGIGLVAAAILLFELQAQRVTDISQVRTKTKLPVIGALPEVPSSFRRARSARQRLAAAYWRDVLHEAFDAVHSMLCHSRRCADARIVMVASSSEREGKSTTTSQLALSFARAGYRVLLIDGDLRRPTLDKEFQLPSKTGFCEVLTGAVPLDQAIQRTEHAELDVLTAGQLTDRIRGLLTRDEHASIFSEVALRYSIVFIDSAPVMLSPDTMSLAKHVDGILMVVRKDVTRLHKLDAALHRFEMIGVPLLGLLSIGLGDGTSLYGYGYGASPLRSREGSSADSTSAPPSPPAFQTNGASAVSA